MNRNRSLFRVLPLALLAGLLASFLTSSCACEAGQLTASEIAPLVETVADDLEAYLETGLAPDGSEQDALAEYLLDNFGAENPFSSVETSRAEDSRIQNLLFREDSVIDGDDGGSGGNGGGNGGESLNEIEGTNGADDLLGTNGDDEIRGLR
ncbi:MAG: hypothetical protein AAFZ87_12890, partial [Planctomycetota bacterium]